MAIVVVGGQSKNVGKTSLVAGIIAALPEMLWTAIKIEPCSDNVCSGGDYGCNCVDEWHTFSAHVEEQASGRTDTSRYLAAGAAKATWLRVREGRMANAMPWIRHEIASAGNTILESNGVLEFLQPDVYLAVLDPHLADFKASALRYLDRADAVVIPKAEVGTVTWRTLMSRLAPNTSVLLIEPPDYCSGEVVGFARKRISDPSGNKAGRPLLA